MQKTRTKDPYQVLINERENAGLDHLNDPNVFIEYTNDMQDVYKILKRAIQERIIASDDMIADMIINKKVNSVVTELFIRGRKHKICLNSYILKYQNRLD